MLGDNISAHPVSVLLYDVAAYPMDNVEHGLLEAEGRSGMPPTEKSRKGIATTYLLCVCSTRYVICYAVVFFEVGD